MKDLLLLFFFTGIFLHTTTVLAADEHKADRAQLLQKLSVVEDAINRKDIDALLPLLDDNVVTIYQNAEVARGVGEVKAYYDKMLGKTDAILKSYSSKASIGAPARFFGDIAVADGRSEDKIVFINGSELVVNTLWSVTLEKQAEEWKVVQLHFSTNLFDNPLLNVAKKNLWIAASAAAVIALIIGFLFGRRRARHG